MAAKGEATTVWLIYLILSLFILAIDRVGWLRPARATTETAVNTISKSLVRTKVLVSAPLAAIKFAVNGSHRVADLESRLAEVLVDQARLEALEKENEALRQLAKLKLPSDPTLLPASVVGGSDMLILAVGEHQGVKVGQTVISPTGILVGEVVQLSAVTSRVRTPLSSDAKIPARVRQKNFAGLISGESSQVKFLKLEQDEVVSRGDTVITSGLEGNFPPGIVIGQVSAVAGEPSAIYQDVSVDWPAVAPAAVVFVIMP
ncbi:hypothetical protein A3A66_02725 [Microgenomates group bacterium RIFCSPLOWO2_01_FULL_46_13]|nr:MAG: hypothetical protein A2783_03015 [Microgenomates group bacterium RIFCSPHIGHO2_01_FULL_45_11]OGV94883.1 MAG: hypothetical protein A3A66_02725 [Microgenomates group bacterium RIFCSPLOWO2_01_FULL_46_13]